MERIFSITSFQRSMLKYREREEDNRFHKKACPDFTEGQANLFIYFDRVYDLTTGFSGNGGVDGAGGGGGGAGNLPYNRSAFWASSALFIS
jgi:hypothetical protein